MKVIEVKYSFNNKRITNYFRHSNTQLEIYISSTKQWKLIENWAINNPISFLKEVYSDHSSLEIVELENLQSYFPA